MDPVTSNATLSADAARIPSGHALRRLVPIGLVVGGVGIGGALVLAPSEPQRFFFSYLTAFVFLWTLTMGALFFVLLQFVTRAGWSVVVRRFAENTMALLPLLAVLFVPLIFGVHTLYHWSHAEAVARDALLTHKQPYLNETFFLVRAGIFFVIWLAAAHLFYRASVAQDQSGDHALTHHMQRYAPIFLILFALTLTYAAFDWLMSLTPHWYSTIYGVYIFAGSVMGIMAWLVIVAATLQRAGLLRRELHVEHYHDLGKLLFAFTAFWAYIAFSQFMLMWYANLPEETIWYAERNRAAWRVVSLVLLMGHFVLPFFFLMSRHIKRRLPLLVGAAVWMLVAHYIDIYWLVMPALGTDAAVPHLIDGALLVGLGGLFVAAFVWITLRSALIPVRDPRLGESLTFENA